MKIKKTVLSTLLPIIMIINFVGCKKDYLNEPVPKCIESNIKEFIRNSTCDKGASVKKYIFQEKIVYVFSPGNCGADFSSMVLNSECCIIGHLGGLIGNTKINGEKFSNAIFQSTIWEK